MRPRLFCVQLVYVVKDHHNLPKYLSPLKKTSVGQVVLVDKWVPLSAVEAGQSIPQDRVAHLRVEVLLQGLQRGYNGVLI